MTKYLVIHTGYSDVQMGLFFEKNLIGLIREESKFISKSLLISFNKLLDEHKINLKELSFIAAHQGPAPFTSLRVTLASINGIGFATGLPLIGVNGLEALISEFKSVEHTTIALLNAFANELYYAVSEPINSKSGSINSKIQFGCGQALDIIENIAKQFKNRVLLIGNGVELYKNQINDLIKEAIIVEPIPEVASLLSIAKMAFEKWKNKEISKEVMPVYLKKYSAKINNKNS